jgi:hypothetical protein
MSLNLHMLFLTCKMFRPHMAIIRQPGEITNNNNNVDNVTEVYHKQFRKETAHIF